MIALEVTTFAKLAAFKPTSAPHSIGWPAGLVHTLHLYPSIHLASFYVLHTMVNHAQKL